MKSNKSILQHEVTVLVQKGMKCGEKTMPQICKFSQTCNTIGPVWIFIRIQAGY